MSNQPATSDFVTIVACLRIIWRFKYFFLHIQPYVGCTLEVYFLEGSAMVH